VVADLTFDERTALTSGVDLWHTAGVDRLGIAGMAVTDGPSGARGATFSGTTSTLVPCGTALASTWNPDLIRRVGELLGDEARAKDSRVLLAPTVNIHRHPLGGRGFECYSEDPHLSAEIATAFIQGVQSRGVGCAVKHFAANDQETDRMSVDVVVDEQALREIYLVPFEAAVRDAGVWVVMAAYNRLGGRFCSEHHELLTEILRDEWGFDGVVVSDWFGTRSVAAIEAGLDLEMPGPAQLLGGNLAAAVELGEVTEAAVDRSATRMLGLMSRTTTVLGEPVEAEHAAAVSREAADEGIVLLHNDGVLPLDRPDITRVAVIGSRADAVHVQGGGSAQVTPPHVISPLRGIATRAADAAISVIHEPGRVDLGPMLINRDHLATGDDGEPGSVTVDFHAVGDVEGPSLHRDLVAETNLIWFGEPAPGVPTGRFSARATARLVPDRTGRWTMSLSSLGSARLLVDGVEQLDTTDAELGGGLLGMFTQPRQVTLDLVAATTYEVVAEIDVADEPLALPADGGGDNLPPLSLAGMTVQVTPPQRPDAVERAVAEARAADVAVVVVGHDAAETEGLDHSTIDLPPDQVALIRQVAAANPATVVVVNTGSPVSAEWADDVAAVIQMSYLGQEAGTALAAVLFGDVDASGRLPTTYPRRIEDTPAHRHFPGGDGTVTYAEGVFVGYRHYDTFDVEPLFCFGHGLSYTTFEYLAPAVEVDGHTARITVDVTNSGERPGREVVQVYVRDLAAPRPRPDRELRAFQKVALDPGRTAGVTIDLDERAFAHWDAELHEWRVAPGDYEILIGSSSRAIHHTIGLRLAE
jgi:beta-glucosidase